MHTYTLYIPPLNAKGASHQELGFNSFEELVLHSHACHKSLADHVEAVAHRKRLSQPVAPARWMLL